MLRFCLAAALCFHPQDSLQDLDSPDPAVARRAFEAAIKAGDESSLEAAAKTSERAKRALVEVRAHKRFGDAYPPVRTYTFTIKDKPFEQALTELGAALGMKASDRNKFPAPAGAPETVSVDIQDAYLFEAMERFAAASKAYLWLGVDGIECSRFSPPSGPRWYWRNFLFVADSFQEQRTVNSFGSTRSSRLELRMMCGGDMRLTGIRRLVIHEALDERGESLAADEQPSSWPVQNFLAGSQYPVHIGLKGLPREWKTLTVRGEIEFLLPQDPHFVEMELGSTAAEVTASGIKVSALLDAAGDAQVTSTIVEPEQPHVRPQAADFQMVDPDGAVMRGAAIPTGPPNAPVQNWKIAGAPKRSRLRIRCFKSVGELAVPFEYKDLPLK